MIDPLALKKMYEDMGVLDCVHVLHAILVEHLGLPFSALPFSYPTGLDANWMLDEIWYSGNFGFHDKRFENGKFTPISAQPDGAYRYGLILDATLNMLRRKLSFSHLFKPPGFLGKAKTRCTV